MPKHRTPRNLVGQVFGRLTVLHMVHPGGTNDQSVWRCRCECGNEKDVRRGSLTSGNTHSCGCLRRETTTKRKTKHGYCGTPEYKIWKAMISRCYNPRSTIYKWYGGRGVKVCEAWRNSFPQFLADVGKRPSDELTIDRIRSDGDYEPGNVRWADWRTQSRNTRRNVYLTFDGRTQVLEDWGKEAGVDPQTIRDRLKRGWTLEKALTTPPQS